MHCCSKKACLKTQVTFYDMKKNFGTWFSIVRYGTVRYCINHFLCPYRLRGTSRRASLWWSTPGSWSTSARPRTERPSTHWTPARAATCTTSHTGRNNTGKSAVLTGQQQGLLHVLLHTPVETVLVGARTSLVHLSLYCTGVWGTGYKMI